MVQVEGIGKIAPAPHDIVLGVGDLRICVREARRRCDYRGYATRPDAWGRGHVDSIVVANVGTIPKEIAPTAAGTIGEYGIGMLIDKRCGTKCQPDFTLLPHGDGGTDLTPNGMRLDAKTRTRDYKTFLVKRVEKYKCEAFVFATWNCGLCVSVAGWLPLANVLDMPVVDARRGDHTNYEIQPNELLPMSRLFDEIKSRKLWH